MMACSAGVTVCRPSARIACRVRMAAMFWLNLVLSLPLAKSSLS
jgi:hypothetical protein